MSDTLMGLFSDVLGLRAEDLSDETSPDNTPEWTSVAAMHLVSTIEDTFDVSLDTREIMAMRTIGKARETLRAKGVDQI